MDQFDSFLTLAVAATADSLGPKFAEFRFETAGPDQAGLTPFLELMRNQIRGQSLTTPSSVR